MASLGVIPFPKLWQFVSALYLGVCILVARKVSAYLGDDVDDKVPAAALFAINLVDSTVNLPSLSSALEFLLNILCDVDWEIKVCSYIRFSNLRMHSRQCLPLKSPRELHDSCCCVSQSLTRG
jgi:hypothetical protein